ncbi:MAG: alpha/beta hydrolase [Bacteroidetes bacterium]|nr:alpha/beta hydrolase [Bacteroidota bacterium]
MKITSKDGTQIAYDKTGNGPALIIVDGAFGYRQNGNTRELVKLLADHFTVYDYDRRGRGESTDTQPYSVDREIEDLNALVEASGESPFVCGFSSGCGLVLQTVDQGRKFKKIALYEPPYVAIHKEDKLPVKEVIKTIEDLISRGKKTTAVNYFLKKVVCIPGILLFFIRLFNPSGWKKNESIAHTLLYDLAVMGDLRFPQGLASNNLSPVLAIGGEKSPERLTNGVKNVAKHVPNSETLFLKGQTHNVSMKAIAPELIRFFK